MGALGAIVRALGASGVVVGAIVRTLGIGEVFY